MQEMKLSLTEKKKSNPCGYNDASILVRDGITVLAASVTQVAFKN